MYENMNYAELELQRDLMLKANTFVTDDDGHPVYQAHIKSLSDEIELRETKARRRLLSAVGAVNVLVLASILWLGLTCGGCVSNTVRGIGGVFEGIGKDTIRAMDGYENNK